jgi:hypothetical protein
MPGPAGDGEVSLVLDSLHAEARKWRKLSDDMGAVRGDAAMLELYSSAFFFADIVSVQGHTDAYREFHDWYVQLLSDATVEFEEIAVALDKSADAYADADTRASVDLTSIYGQQPEGN